MDDIEVGQEFYGVIGKLIIDPETNRRRVFTISDQIVPEGLYIECDKKIREESDIDTLFKLNVGVSRKPIGRIYLRSLKKHELLTIEEYGDIYGR